MLILKYLGGVKYWEVKVLGAWCEVEDGDVVGEEGRLILWSGTWCQNLSPRKERARTA